MHRFSSIFTFFLAVFLAPLASAQNSVLQSDFTQGLIKGSPLALGGAYRALANDNNAVLLNPAGIMQNKHLAASVDWLTSDNLKTDTLGGAIVDTRSEDEIGVGFGYDQVSQEILGNDIDYRQFTLAMATTLSQGTYIGFNVKYYQSSVQSPLFDGPDGFTADLGFLWYAIPSLSVAATLQNMIEGTDNPNVPFLLSGAVAFRPDQRSALTFDVVQDLSTTNNESTNFHFGGQLSLSEDFTMRLGYGIDRIRDNPFFGTGILVTAPRAQVGFTYARHFEPGTDTYSAYLELRL